LLMYQRFAYLAQFFEDRATARMIFAKPQAVWSTAAEEVWGVRDGYDVARRWADTQPAQTFVNAPGAKQSHGTGVAAGDESTSWIAGGASKWPPLFLVNDVKTSDGLHYLFNSFLVRSNIGIVGITALTKFGKQQTYTSGSGKQAIFVTAIKLPLFRAHLENWTMYQPGKATVTISPSSIESNSTNEALHGVVLKFDSSTKLPPVHVFAPYRAIDKQLPHGRVYVVACKSGIAPCKQAAFAGEIKGGGEGGGQRGITILLDEPVPWGDLIGSPVIDESGEVLAVAAAASEPVMRAADNAVFIHAEDVNSVLARAGLSR
jgi:hypothetical protein